MADIFFEELPFEAIGEGVRATFMPKPFSAYPGRSALIRVPNYTRPRDAEGPATRRRENARRRGPCCAGRCCAHSSRETLGCSESLGKCVDHVVQFGRAVGPVRAGVADQASLLILIRLWAKTPTRVQIRVLSVPSVRLWSHP